MRCIRVSVLILAILLCVNFVGCAGDKTDVKSDPCTVTTTLGQELIDLEKAYKDEIITQKEYEKAKNRLIEMRTK